MSKQVEINTAAPEFALPDFRGEMVRLSDFQYQQHVLLVFNRGLT
jgi:peroxiredoxin